MRAERRNRSIKLLPKQIDQMFIGCAPGGALDNQPHRRRCQRVLADNKGGRCQLGLRFVRRYRSRSEEHTSELQSLMRISYAVFCLKKKKPHTTIYTNHIVLSSIQLNTYIP